MLTLVGVPHVTEAIVLPMGSVNHVWVSIVCIMNWGLPSRSQSLEFMMFFEVYSYTMGRGESRVVEEDTRVSQEVEEDTRVSPEMEEDTRVSPEMEGGTRVPVEEGMRVFDMAFGTRTGGVGSRARKNWGSRKLSVQETGGGRFAEEGHCLNTSLAIGPQVGIASEAA